MPIVVQYTSGEPFSARVRSLAEVEWEMANMLQENKMNQYGSTQVNWAHLKKTRN